MKWSEKKKETFQTADNEDGRVFQKLFLGERVFFLSFNPVTRTCLPWGNRFGILDAFPISLFLCRIGITTTTSLSSPDNVESSEKPSFFFFSLRKRIPFSSPSSPYSPTFSSFCRMHFTLTDVPVISILRTPPKVMTLFCSSKPTTTSS